MNKFNDLNIYSSQISNEDKPAKIYMTFAPAYYCYGFRLHARNDSPTRLGYWQAYHWQRGGTIQHNNEMNALISQQVITPIGEFQTLAGKQITFAGAFTLADINAIVVALA